MKNLKQLIKQNKLDWVNSNITEKNFPIQPEDNEKAEYKLFNFDRYISSEDAIKEMDKDDFRPATIRELLSWKDWNGKDFVVGLGSVWRGGLGNRYVPILYCDGEGRVLDLGWCGGVWHGNFRFLGVRKLLTKDLEPKTSKSLDILTLDGKEITIDGKVYMLELKK